MKRWLIMIGTVLLLVAVIGGIWGYNLSKKIAGFKAMGVPKQTVSTVKADYQIWRGQVQAVGTVRAVKGADLAAEVAGVVDKIHFESGADVKAGTPLIELRAADERARLVSLRAAAELAELNYKRNQAQFDAQAVSRAQLDSDLATLKGARAQVAEQQALLDKKQIRAPFSGQLGIRAVDVGQFISAGSKIVTLQAIDPVYLDFYVPQQTLSALKVGQPVTVKADTWPDAQFAGKITSLEPKIEVETRNVQVRATLQNAEHKLLPGMFASVGIEVGEPARYLTVPQTAVTYNPYGETVYVVSTVEGLQAAGGASAAAAAGPGADPKTQVAKQVFVTVGPARGDQVAILKGVQPGEEVITSGQLKLKNGMPIVVNNRVTPTNDADPKPVDQ